MSETGKNTIGRKVLMLEQLARELHAAAIDLLQHPECTGPDSPPMHCYRQILEELALVDNSIMETRLLLWRHIYQGQPQ